MAAQATAASAAAEGHVDGQVALSSLIVGGVAQAWPLLDVHDIRGTLPRLVAAIQAIVARYGPASSVAALQHYQASRRSQGVPGRPVSRLAPQPASTQVEQAVSDAVAGLYGTVTPESEQAALDAVNAEAEKLVLDQSRQTVIDAVHADRYARAWARVPNAGACSFCLMLATRGAVYKDARAAGRSDPTAEWADAKGYINSFHPNCRCHVEPVFGVYEPTARVREAQALWDSSTKGMSGKDALKAFRRAVEDRSDGPTRDRVKAPDGGPILGSGMTRAQVENQVRILEGLKDSDYRTRRLAELRGLLAR